MRIQIQLQSTFFISLTVILSLSVFIPFTWANNPTLPPMSKFKTTSESPDELPIQTDEQINEALNQIKLTDIDRYKYFSTLKRKNFDKFIKLLNKHVIEYDPERNSKEKYRLIREERAIRRQLEKISRAYRNTKDEIKRKALNRKIKVKIVKLYQIEIAQMELLVRLKKQEISRMKTKLHYRKEKKKSELNNLHKKYLGSSEPSSLNP